MSERNCSEFNQLVHLFVERVWCPHLRDVVERAIAKYQVNCGENASFQLGEADSITMCFSYSTNKPGVVELNLYPVVPQEGEEAQSVDLTIPRKNSKAGDDFVEVVVNMPPEESKRVLLKVLVAFDILPVLYLKTQPSLN